MRKMGDGIRSFAAVPIMAKEKILAVMGVGSRKYRAFPDWEMLMLDTIANQIGMAIENAQLYEHALELAFTDGLTGLYNRRYIMEQIEREFIRAQRSKAPLSLIMVDLDGLKAITHVPPMLQPGGGGMNLCSSRLEPIVEAQVRLRRESEHRWNVTRQNWRAVR
jgi:GAF domain-containing protein